MILSVRLAASLAIVAPILAGCAILPASAPTARELTSDAAKPDSEFVVIDVDARVISIVGGAKQGGFGAGFSDRRSPVSPRIGAGDTLQISIWEAGAGGLFGGSAPAATAVAPAVGGARVAVMQPVVVGADGMISVPYAGMIPAAGQTPGALRRQIEDRLMGKAIQPQVQVAVASSAANAVSVNGEVNRAGVVALSPRGDRLLDIIANAGGPKLAAVDTRVTLTRAGVTRSVILQRVVDNPADNIGMRPGDSVFLTRAARTFTAFGAAGKVGHYPFEVADLTLAEALATAGGLVDAIADPAAVYLFRYETAQTVRMLLPPGEAPASIAARTPVVYRVNLREANGYFMAKSFGMRDKDVILAANADGAQLLKFFMLLRGATGLVRDIRSTTAASD